MDRGKLSVTLYVTLFWYQNGNSSDGKLSFRCRLFKESKMKVGHAASTFQHLGHPGLEAEKGHRNLRTTQGLDFIVEF